jgi:hypothetical protein
MIVFHPMSQLMKCNDRKMAQSSLLVGGEGLIERLPRIGEFL